MTIEIRATVVVAIEHSLRNLPAILARLDCRAHREVEFLFCHAETTDPIAALGASAPNVNSLRAAPGARIPHLWRDGILAARAERIALTTAHCIPADDWLDRVLALDLASDEAGVGGYFVNRAGASATDWAIYLLRYARFSRPHSSASVPHIAADNAVYRRSAILACADLLPGGFWEPAYHDRFRAGGMRLRLSPDLVVEHANAYTATQFAAQRRAHGREFGRERAQPMPTMQRALYLLASPLIPFVLFAKVIGAAARENWLAQVPLRGYFWLGWFVLNWALGEARGLLDGVQARTRGEGARAFR